MSKQVKIEPARNEDGKQVMDLISDSAEMFQSNSINMPAEVDSFVRIFIDFFFDVDKCLIVARDGEDLIGVITGYIEGPISDRSARFGWESLFYIRPEYRGDGIARKLLTAFEEWCASKGVKTIIMGCMSKAKGDKFEKFYSRYGYEPYSASYVKEVRK